MAFRGLEYILLAYLIYVISFPFGCPVIAEETTDNYFNDSMLIQTYKEEICHLEETCHIIDQIPQSLQDLRTRNCMCDEKCPYYRDCCKDANPSEVDLSIKFVCTKTRFDGNVYMIESCPDEWNEKSIKEKCLAQNSTQLSHDILSKLPVTSTANEITYSNVFCAICNEQRDYEFWNIGFTYELSESSNDHLTIDARDVLANLSFNGTGEMIWSSYVNESLYKCYLEPKVPSRITSLRYCVPDVIRSCQNGEICEGFTSYIYYDGQVYENLECAECNNAIEEPKGCPEPQDEKLDEFMVEIPITDPLLPKVPHCDDFPKNTSAYSLFCQKEDTSETRNQTEDCFGVGKKSKISCLINKNYSLSHNDYYFVNNETIFIYEYDMEYPKSEWEPLDDDEIYVCGRQIPKTRYQRIMSTIIKITTEILIKVSIFCIVLHLLTFFQRPELQHLLGLNLACLCASLIIALVSVEIGPWLPSCKITAIIAHYGFLSSVSWMLVISYDIWFDIYTTLVKHCQPEENLNLKLYIIYCMIGWIIPIFAVGPAVYAEFAPSNVVSCDLKPGYGEFDQCFIGALEPHLDFFLYPTLVVFIGYNCFFAGAAYLMYLSGSIRGDPVELHNFNGYVKLGLLMGLTWILGLLVALTESELLALLFTVVKMSQGVFIFYKFTLDREIIQNSCLYYMHRRRQDPEPDPNGFVMKFIMRTVLNL